MGRHSPDIAVTIVVLIAISSVTGFSAGDVGAPETDDAGMIRAILEQVEAQREEIFSAKIVYRWHIASYRGAANTPDRVHALLDEYDLIGDPDSLRQLVQALGPYPNVADPPWDVRTFHMLGEQRRTDSTRSSIQLVDHEHEMRYDVLDEQLTVDHREKSNVHFTSITDFRSYPSAPPSGFQPEDFRIASHTPDQVTLEFLSSMAAENENSSRYTFDRTTGVMTACAVYARGQLLGEVWQRGLTEYPGGIVMPALRVAAQYDAGALSALRVFLIEEAEFNGPVPEDKFVMSVAEGTVVVDSRFPKTTARKTKQAVADVRSILLPVSSSVAAIKPSGGPNWRTVLILNGIALIVVAAVLWRRSSRTSPRTGSRGAESP